MSGKGGPRLLATRVTHLEMTVPAVMRVPTPSGLRLALMRATNMPLPFYRFMYEQVGKAHHWAMRRNVDDDALAEVIHAEATQIHLLYADGSPAGFFELDLSDEQCADIVYFGLVPHFQGRGLARFLLSEAIAAAWANDPARVTIETNTLDNPRALQIYQKMGFLPVAWREEVIEAWD
ncbi:MAG: GNAT family N-acetyltransferase [Phyllobacterium sp.]